MGEVFAGRYELIDVLDSGGVGTVWRAWDHRERGYRAAKVLRQSDSDSLLRFVRETSRHIDHPHVVAPCSWSGEDDRVLFTMPLVRGGSLATLLSDFGALPIGYTIELLRQALRALDAVHRAGLVHRDVKPANLLLDATGRQRPHLRLSDFGAAAQVDAPRLTRADRVIGTPGYLAPEQLRGVDPHPAQDIYAVAVVAIEMSTGEQPTVAGGLPVLSLTGDCGRALAALLGRMTDRDPRRRPQTADLALELLDQLPDAHDLALGADPLNPLEIFDHVGPLPEGWGPDGPESAGPDLAGASQTSDPRVHPDQRAASSAAATIVMVAHPRPGRVPTTAWLLAVVGVLLIAVAVLLEVR